MQPTQPPLSETLGTLLQRPRGGREAVDTLLENLSPWDLLYLRRRAKTLAIDRKAFASWSDLPFDIVYQISFHLSFDDFLAARLVSRAWRDTWLQDKILAHVLNKRYPGFLQTSPGTDSMGQMLSKALFTYRRKPINGLRGTFIPWFLDTEEVNPQAYSTSGMPVYKLARQLVCDFSEGPVISPMFCDGRMAWQMRENRFAVDDIKNAKRTVYTFPADRRKGPSSVGRLVALTDKLLVACTQNVL